MARIPTQFLPQVGPSGQGAPMPRNAPVGGFDALTRGAQQFGQGLGGQLEKAAAEYDKREEESREKARAAEVAEGETEWTKYRTERKYGRRASGKGEAFDAAEEAFNGEETEQPGYFNTKGDEAFEKAPETFDSIEKKRQEIADNMSDEDARQAFLKRTAPHLEEDRAHIEQYAGKQRQVADAATLEAREEAALEAIRANPNDWVGVTSETAALEEPIAKLGLSAEDKKARVEAWRRKAGVAQVVSQLNAGDWAAAEKTLESKRATIGDEAGEKLEAQIARLKGDHSAQAAASSIAAAAADKETGRINEAKALQLLEQTPIEQRKAVSDRLDHLIVQNERMWRQEVSTTYDSAFSTYLQTRDLDQVRPSTKAWLVKNAPEKWDELEQKAKRDREYWKKLLRGENAEGSTRAEQLALVELQSDLVRNPEKYANMSPQEFDYEWGARLSPSGYKIGGKAFADASKGDRLSDAEFSTYVNQLVDTYPRFAVENPADRQEKLDKGQLADAFRADFGEARRAFRDREKRNPTMSEVQSPDFQKQIWTNALKRSGIKLEMQLPEMDFSDTPPIHAAKPSKAARARELKDTGLSNADIAKQLTAEGY